jgi:uncharacterized protein (UPF0332 family)
MENNKVTAQYELEKACDALKEAHILYEAEGYSGSANRSYYAAFHAMSAILAYDGYRFKSHAGVLARFREYYIKTGEIDKSISPKVDKLFRIRTSCDYDVFYVVSKTDVAEQLESAKDIITAVEGVLERKLTQKQNLQQEQPLRNDLVEQQQQDGYAASAPHTPQTISYAAEEQKVDNPKQTASLPKKSQEKGGRHI